MTTIDGLEGKGFVLEPTTVFKGAYESLGLDASSGKLVSMQKIWHLIQTLMGEGSTIPRDVSKKMSLVIGARRHLEWGHEKYIIDNKCTWLVVSAIAAGLGALTHILGTLIPVIGASGFATAAATTAIGTVIGSFR